jgi:hypothetical protein
MILNQDFREFIALLNAHHVEYLVVGGYAVAFHGHPRFTGDLDLWIRASSENAVRVIAVLHDFGFSSFGFQPDDLTGENQILQLGYPPVRIDIMTTVDGVGFDECYKQKDVVSVGSLSINIIDLEHLKANKRATGRLRDLDDLEHLT